MTANSFQDGLEQRDGYWLGRFTAMASPNEVLLEVDSCAEAEHLFQITVDETRRIEHKFSRYRDDNIIHEINHAEGQSIMVDDETADLLDYAACCYELSDGLFDITSGVLRHIWKFDGSDKLPDSAQVDALLKFIGWYRVQWQRPYFTLPSGMEIDLGGIGKEYAVDRCVNLMQQQSNASMVVNFGGDLFVTGPRLDGSPWIIGIDNPAASGIGCLGHISLNHGALTTSGDARRFLFKDGVRYCHILNPKTGWPIANAPHAVTVVASTCMEAGILSTIALLQGEHADEFLKAQQVPYWLN